MLLINKVTFGFKQIGQNICNVMFKYYHLNSIQIYKLNYNEKLRPKLFTDIL